MSDLQFGPAWAAPTCCGKPIGCSNRTDQCTLRNHKWKRENCPAKEETSE